MNALIEPALENQTGRASTVATERDRGAYTTSADPVITLGRQVGAGWESGSREFAPPHFYFAGRGIPSSPLHDV